MSRTRVPEVKDRVRAFRQAIGQTQEQVAAGSGGRLNRCEVNKIESGRTKATSHETRKGLAQAFGLEIEDADAVLDGTLSIEAALAVRAARIRAQERAQAQAEARAAS